MIDWLYVHPGLLGLVFFFVFFVGMAAWVYRPGSAQAYQDQGNIPLMEK